MDRAEIKDKIAHMKNQLLEVINGNKKVELTDQQNGDLHVVIDNFLGGFDVIDGKIDRKVVESNFIKFLQFLVAVLKDIICIVLKIIRELLLAFKHVLLAIAVIFGGEKIINKVFCKLVHIIDKFLVKLHCVRNPCCESTCFEESCCEHHHKPRVYSVPKPREQKIVNNKCNCH